jgi:murein DD-endopeptidase MepM/ murein hydrolase activator NlpD
LTTLLLLIIFKEKQYEMKKIFIRLAILLGVVIIGLILSQKVNQDQTLRRVSKKQSLPPPADLKITAAEAEFALPVAEFEKRITKKPFGVYITPESSPVQPERFEGYHTGVDVEFGDKAEPVPVFAICNGSITLNQWVSGYGGTLVLKCQVEGETIYALYGHLDPKSINKKSRVKKGEGIAVLGEGFSQATDHERKHLHLSISRNNSDLRGYVARQDELQQWYDPQEFLLR